MTTPYARRSGERRNNGRKRPFGQSAAAFPVLHARSRSPFNSLFRPKDLLEIRKLHEMSADVQNGLIGSRGISSCHFEIVMQLYVFQSASCTRLRSAMKRFVSLCRISFIFFPVVDIRTLVRYNEMDLGVVDAIGNPYSRLRAIALALRDSRLRAIALALRDSRLRAIALALRDSRLRATALALRARPIRICT